MSGVILWLEVYVYEFYIYVQNLFLIYLLIYFFVSLKKKGEKKEKGRNTYRSKQIAE